nr:expressed protein [Hymenolepis microstoma]
MPLKLKQKGKSNVNTSNKKDLKADLCLNSKRNCDTTTEINVDLTIPKPASCYESNKERVNELSVQIPLADPCSRIDACNVSISSHDTCMQSPARIKSQNGIFPVKRGSSKYLSFSKKIKAPQLPRRFQKSSNFFTKTSSSGKIEEKISVVNEEQGNEIRRENSSIDKERLNEKEGTNPFEPSCLDRTGEKEKEDRSIMESSLQQNGVMDQLKEDSLKEVNEGKRINDVPELDIFIKFATHGKEEITEKVKQTPDLVCDKEVSQSSALCSINDDVVHSPSDQINPSKQIFSNESDKECIQNNLIQPNENLDTTDKGICSNLSLLLETDGLVKQIQAMKDQLNKLEQTVKSRYNVGVSVSKHGNEIDGIGNQLPNDFHSTQSVEKDTEQDNYPNEDVNKLSLSKEASPKPLVNKAINDVGDDYCIATKTNADDRELDILLNMRLPVSGDKCNLTQEKVECFLEQLQILIENDVGKNPTELPLNNSPQYLASSTPEESPVSTTPKNESVQNVLKNVLKETQDFDDDSQKKVILLLEEIILILETLRHCQVEKQSCNLDQNVRSTPRLRCLTAQLKSAIQPFHSNPSMPETSDVSGELGYLVNVLGEILRNECMDCENLVRTGQILCYIDDEFQQQGNSSHPLDVNIRNVMEIIKIKLVHPPSGSSNPNEERIPNALNSILSSTIDDGKSLMRYQNEQCKPTAPDNFVDSSFATVLAKFRELVQKLDKELSSPQGSTVVKLLSKLHQIWAILNSNCDNICQVNEIKDILNGIAQKMTQSDSECLQAVKK